MRTHEATEREAAGHPGPTSGPNLQPVLSGALLETAPSPGSRQNRGMQGGGVGCRGGRDRRRCEPLRRSRERARRKPSAGDVGLHPPNRPRPVQMREPASPIRCILLTLKRCSPSALVAPHSRRPRAGAPQGPSGKKYRDPARAVRALRGRVVRPLRGGQVGRRERVHGSFDASTVREVGDLDRRRELNRLLPYLSVNPNDKECA